MGQTDVERGFFSLLRWRFDPTRDEAKNVAVLLVSPDIGASGVRAAPLSRVSGELKEQGILDSMLVNVEQRLRDESKLGVEVLSELHQSLERSVVVTAPQPVAVSDVTQVLNALYKAYVAPRGGGGGGPPTKGAVLDRVVTALRNRGVHVGRGEYIGDFIFDAVVDAPEHRTILEVLSFAPTRKDWTPVLHDAGHFLFALERIDESGAAFVEPPGEAGDQKARLAFERATRWFADSKVRVLRPDDLNNGQEALFADL
jgi:hypothetical protein